MTNGATTHAAAEDRYTLDAVRPAVRDLLLSVPAFKELSPEEQEKIASGMVKIATYMSNPSGALTPLSSAQADAVETTKRRLAKALGQVGQDFEAGAVEQGVQQFGALVQKVDFPAFVGGLIKNVFQAIVQSSIDQMRAYGELIANVAKTVDQFAQDNITENNARDWLSDKYPDALRVNTGTDTSFADDSTQPPPSSKLKTKGDNAEDDLKEISTDLNLDKPVTDISDEAEEARLVQACRLQMMRSRQQLLASMVMMGINRIVVTDGEVIFDMRAQDTASRKATASMSARQSSSNINPVHADIGGWMSPVDASIDKREQAGPHTSVIHEKKAEPP